MPSSISSVRGWGGGGQVERLLQAEQNPSDFKPPEDGAVTDHRPTKACLLVESHLKRIADMAVSCLEGGNRQAFLLNLVWPAGGGEGRGCWEHRKTLLEERGF